MVCLDTCFIADLFRKNSDAEKKLLDLVNAGEEISITIISVAELYYGAYKSKRKAQEKVKVKEAVEKFNIFELELVGAEKFGALMSDLDRTGNKIADRDVLIAAIALSHGEKSIVTRNEKDFAKISELSVTTY